MRAGDGSATGVRRVASIISALAVIACAALVACGGGSSDAARVSDNVAREATAIRRGDWQTWYSLFSPRSKQGCTYNDFLVTVHDIILGPGVDYSTYDVRSLKVTVSGNSAAVTYVSTLGGKDLGAAASDRHTWVRVDGEWFDDSRGISACDATVG